MKFGDIDFGVVEGKDEFNLSKKDIGERINNTFLLDSTINIENFINGNKTFIYGHKGTGKTSLLKYIEYLSNSKYKNKSCSILFKDIKNNTLTYSTFLKLLGDVKDKNRAAKAFWQWYILSLIIIENNIDEKEENLIFYTDNTLFSKLSNFLTKIITKYTFNGEKHKFEIGIDGQDLCIDENKDILNAGIKIEILKDTIQEQLKENFYIFIDELETSKISDNFHDDSILIKNLITVVDTINQISDKLFIILAVRTEVLNNVFATGAEINKLLESKGECIQWEYERYSTEHPLIKIIIKKLKYSMLNSGDEETIKKAKKMNYNQIFSYWFDKELVDNTDNPAQIILNNTWLKPRDIIRLMNLIQKEAFYSEKINKTFFKNAIKKYSDASWIEIQEEFTSILDEKTINYLIKAFTNFKPEFDYTELKARLIRLSNYTHPEVDEIIDKIYEIGIIGNKFLNDYGRLSYQYSFRGNRFLDKNKNIELHKGLWEYFSVSPKKRRIKDNIKNNGSDYLELIYKLTR